MKVFGFGETQGVRASTTRGRLRRIRRSDDAVRRSANERAARGVSISGRDGSFGGGAGYSSWTAAW